MKKIVASGLLAFCLIAMSQQQASAWVNSKFGIGLNWDYQSGGNSVLWGLWRNGQPPGPEAFGGGAGRLPYGAPQYGPGPQYFAPQTMAPQGIVPQGFQQQGFAPVSGFEPNMIDPSGRAMNYGSPYQFANYPRPVYYYPAPYYGR